MNNYERSPQPTRAELNTVGPYPRPVREIGGLGLTVYGNKFPLTTDSDAQFDAYVGFPEVQADFVFQEEPEDTAPITRSRLAC